MEAPPVPEAPNRNEPPIPCQITSTLDGLPTEVLFSIISFTSPFVDRKPRHRFVNELAAVNRTFRNIAEGYSRSVLLQEATDTNSQLRKGQTYRGKYIRWLNRTCQTCKKPSKRKAILDPTETMCRACDYKIPKVTMTYASGRFLSKLELFTPNPLYPYLPPLRHGKYTVLGTLTNMFHADDFGERKRLFQSVLRTKAAPPLSLPEIDAVLMLRRKRLEKCWQDIRKVLQLYTHGDIPNTPSEVPRWAWRLAEVTQILDGIRAWEIAGVPFSEWSILGHGQCRRRGSSSNK